MEREPIGPEYSDLRTNPVLIDLYRANSEALGRPIADPSAANRVVASTDMGNVSYWVPSIHPMIAVSPPDVPLHSAEFARWAASEEGDRAVLDGAKAMAMTVMDLWLTEGLAQEVRAAFGSGP
jgi:metal-dependent amidase/aminoacylase/carboxypeptidase family protein